VKKVRQYYGKSSGFRAARRRKPCKETRAKKNQRLTEPPPPELDDEEAPPELELLDELELLELELLDDDELLPPVTVNTAIVLVAETAALFATRLPL
jgi:hypothetical protein